MNDFKAHGLRSMGLLVLATEFHGKDRSRDTEKKEEEKTFLPRNDTKKNTALDLS